MFKYLLIFLMALTAITSIEAHTAPSVDNGNEAPNCYSRFDYESKMLERIVMVEHRMNLLEASTKQSLVDLIKEKDKMTEEIKSELKSTSTQQSEKLEEMETFLATKMGELRDEQNLNILTLLETGKELQNTSKLLVDEQNNMTNHIKADLSAFTGGLKEDVFETKVDLLRNVTAFYSGIEDDFTLKIDGLSDVQTNLLALASELKEEQKLKLAAVEKIGDDIKLDIKLRMLNLESQDNEQETKYKNVLTEFSQMVNDTWANIKTEGFHIKPPVAFHVQNADSNPDTRVLFKEELINTQSVYSTEDGYFTAPVKGVYIFSAQMCGYQQKNVNYMIFAQNKVLSSTSMYDYDSNESCVSASAITLLAKGDKVCVRKGNNGLIINNDTSMSAFMGALIN